MPAFQPSKKLTFSVVQCGAFDAENFCHVALGLTGDNKTDDLALLVRETCENTAEFFAQSFTRKDAFR